MTNPETAVTVIEPTAALQVNLDAWPDDKFNRLLPVQTLGLATDLIKPIVQAVVAQPAGPDGKSPDHYTSPDIPNGRRALTKRFLDALASAAGVDITEVRRLDDGSDPTKCGVQVRAEMLLPTGRRITAIRSKWTDMARMPWSGGLTGAQAAKFRATIYEHTESRACNRAIRAILSLQQSYSIEELRRPFAVLSFVPNMDHPDIRSRILDAMAPAIAATYGPSAGRAQLAAGEYQVPEGPDDDDEPVVETPRQLAPGRASGAAAPVVVPDTAPQAPGAPAAPGALEEPSWMRDVPGGAGVEEAATREPGIRDIVAERLADEGQPKGPVNGKQQDMLKGIFSAFPESERGALYAAGIRALFEVTWKDLTCAQARAIGMAHDELGAQAFAAAWRELAS